MFARLSLRVRLALLVAGTALPLILFAAAIIFQHYQQERAQAFERVVQVARAIRLVTDAELASMAASLEVLALTQSLQRGDLEGFRRDAEAFLTRYPETSSVSLALRDGTQVLDARIPAGQPLPRRANLETIEQVFNTGRPVFSRLFVGAILGKPMVTVSVPVRRDDRIVYDLSFNPPLRRFQSIVEQQRPDEGWTISIFDQSGVNIARVPNPVGTLGQRAVPTLLRQITTRPEGQIESVTREGVALIAAFTRSPLSGWTVSLGLPTASVTGPLLKTLFVTTTIGSLLLLVGLAFALRMARHVTRGEEMHALLVNELNHRVKNTLSTVQSIAGRTFRDAPDPAEARVKFDQRLSALGRAHDVLSEEKWHSADMRDIVDRVLAPYAVKDAGRIQMTGPPVRLAPRCAVMMSMALHELATNAAKYGALSGPNGKIVIAWTVGKTGDDRVRLRWEEHGGPPVEATRRKGFGSTLIEQSFPAQLNGQSILEFGHEGVTCTLECPIA